MQTRRAAMSTTEHLRLLLCACVLVQSFVAGVTTVSGQGYGNESQYTVTPTASIVFQFDEVTLQASQGAKFSPPLVARALAVVHTCLYDAWAAYDEEAHGSRLGSALRQRKEQRVEENKRAALAYAGGIALLDLFPPQTPKIVAFVASLGFDLNNRGSLPAAVGETACNAVLAFRHRDGSNQLGDDPRGQIGVSYSDISAYLPVNTATELLDIYRWQPLAVMNASGQVNVQKFLLPHWGYLTPFSVPNLLLLTSKTKHPQYDWRGYRQQVKELVRLQEDLSDRQKMISEYWSDGPNTVTPPGHWALLAQKVSLRDRLSLDEDVVLFFALGSALLDSSIACWWLKRQYEYVRPITAVHVVYRNRRIRGWRGPGRGVGPISGGDWKPYQSATLVTPAFPEFVSGHSTFSGAAATVLRLFTGSDDFNQSVDLAPGSSSIEPGITPATVVTLQWPTFKDAAEEAGMSREYGGIHFKGANKEGQLLGSRTGKAVWKKVQDLIKGKGN